MSPGRGGQYGRDMADPTAESTATVHLFAALRDAAGTGRTTVPAPTPLPRLLADLDARFGPRFAERRAIAAVMIDGEPVDREADVQVGAGQEVALLPPFAGGADTFCHRWHDE